MSFNVTIGLNDETLTALTALTAAIQGAPAGAATVKGTNVAAADKALPETATKAVTKAAVTTKAKVEEVAEEEEAPVTIYWFSSATDTIGIVESEAEFKALKKKDAKTVKFTETKYNAKLAEQAAAEATDEAGEEDAPVPTEDDIIAIFGAYLPTTLSDEEKAERRPFVKAILDRFGAKKATALPEESRALAINLVQRKMAGEDVDAATDEFEAIDEDSLV